MTTDGIAHRGRILVVDDDVVLRNMLDMTLSEAGHQVAQASDGLKALDALLRDRSANCLPDILVSDVNMPNLDGIGLLERMASEGIRVPALVMTSQGDKALVVRLLRLGAEEFVDKPVDHSELLLRIGAMLRRIHEDKSHSGLEIQFEGKHVRLDQDPNQVRRMLERARDRVDALESEEKGRIHLPSETIDLDLAWCSRQRHELNTKIVTHLSTEKELLILAAHPVGHDALALETSAMIRMIFSASINPRKGCGEGFLQKLGAFLYQQPKQPQVHATLLHFDYPSNTLEVSSAGHPTPLLVPHGSGPRSALPEMGSVLGPTPNPLIETATVPFHPADRIFLPCPWLPRLTKLHSPTGTAMPLGLHGLSEFALASRNQPLHGMLGAIWESAMEFAHWNTTEDLFILGLERKYRN